MPSFQHGVQRAFTEGVGGLVISVFASSFFSAYGVPSAIILFNVISILSIVFLIDKMTYWSLTYIVGWLFGLLVIGAHVFSLIEFLLYLAVTGIAFYIKVNNQL